MNDSKLKYFDSTPLPHNFLAEQGVLNILLTNPALIENVFLSLKIDAFYYVPHKLIYQTIVELYESQQNINVLQGLLEPALLLDRLQLFREETLLVYVRHQV